MDRLLKLGLLVLGIACLSVYGYLFWSGRIAANPGPAALPSPPPESVDLWDAHERGRAAAEQVEGVVKTVSASTQWQAATENALLAGSGQWSFKFFAPESKNILEVVVSKESARVANQAEVRKVPLTLAEGIWQDGPRDPLLAFLARGGREFLEGHQQAVVSVHLATSEDKGPLWDIAALNVDDRSVFAARIDAATQRVLSTASEHGES